MTKSEFIEKIGTMIAKKAREYGYRFPSAIIAQACIESCYGQSGLSAIYHNYFGLKCGSYWKGRSVNMVTREEYTPGTVTKIKDNFRVYDDMEAGVEGYFQFIGTARYANLLQAQSPRDYLEKIKADGYATSSKYVETVYNCLLLHHLDRFDVLETEPVYKDLNDAITVIAQYVIKGFFGDGHELRRHNIYNMVREEVNRLAK